MAQKKNFIAYKPLKERKYSLTDSTQRAAGGGIAVRYAKKNGLLRAIRTEDFTLKAVKHFSVDATA